MLKWKNKSFKPNSFTPATVKDKDISANKASNSIFKISTFKKNPLKVTTFDDKDNYSEINCDVMEASNGFMVMGRNITANNFEKVHENSANNSLDHTNNFMPFDPDLLDDKTTDNPLYNAHSPSVNIADTPTSEYHNVLGPLESSDCKMDEISQNIDDLSLNSDSNMVVEHKNNSIYEPLNPKVYDNNIDGPNQESDLLSNKMTIVATVESDYLSRRNLLNSNLMDNEYEEIYIPEPDYDEDEVTLNFKNEDSGNTDSKENSPVQVFKNYEGEDFGQYLSDEEDLVDMNGYTWRKNIQYQSSTNQTSQKANTEIKRNRLKNQRISQKLFKSAPKIKGNIIRHNLRDFSYADTKISVKPTNEKVESRYQKKDEKCTEDDDFMRTKNSYEQFLSSRQSNDNQGTKWTEKELETKSNECQAETKPPKRTKKGNNTIVGKLTSKLRPKSDTSYYLATSLNSLDISTIS